MPETMDLIRTFLQDVRPHDTILDIGANIGGYSKLFRENCPEATIHAFEPIPSVFRELSQSMVSDQKFFRWNLGVGAQVETLRGVAVHEAWTINKPGETVRGRNATYGQDTFDMHVTTVDSFLLGWPQSGGNVSAIKIDTDGYDFRVLQGATETITRCRPRILIEFGYLIVDIGGKSDVERMVQWIEDLMRYDIYDASGVQVDPEDFLRWYPFHTTADFLLVPNDKALNPRP